LPISIKRCVFIKEIPGPVRVIEDVTDLDKFNLFKFANEVLLLGLRQALILFQLPQRRNLSSKVVKRDSKIIILLH